MCLHLAAHGARIGKRFDSGVFRRMKVRDYRVAEVGPGVVTRAIGRTRVFGWRREVGLVEGLREAKRVLGRGGGKRVGWEVEGMGFGIGGTLMAASPYTPRACHDNGGIFFMGVGWVVTAIMVRGVRGGLAPLTVEAPWTGHPIGRTLRSEGDWSPLRAMRVRRMGDGGHWGFG